MQKQQYLHGLLQNTYKNNNICKVFWKARSKTTIFTWFSATHIQKQQYLQRFLQKTCKNNNIYTAFCSTHAKTAIFTRCSATSVQKHKYLQGFCATHMQKQGLPYLWSGAVAEMSKSRTLVTSGWQHWICNLIIQESVNVEFMEPGNLGTWDQEMKTLKIKICVAQNVRKVWASFEAIVPKPKNAQTKAFLLIFFSWP